MEEGDGVFGTTDGAIDEGEVEAGGGLAGIGVDEAVEEMDGFGDVAVGGVDDGEVGERDGVVGVGLEGGSIGGAGFRGVA